MEKDSAKLDSFPSSSSYILVITINGNSPNTNQNNDCNLAFNAESISKSVKLVLEKETPSNVSLKHPSSLSITQHSSQSPFDSILPNQSELSRERSPYSSTTSTRLCPNIPNEMGTHGTQPQSLLPSEQCSTFNQYIRSALHESDNLGSSFPLYGQHVSEPLISSKYSESTMDESS